MQDRAERAAPAVRELLLVSNNADGAISNAATEAFADVWRGSGAAVRTYAFPADLALDHDVIDPNHPEQRVELVYPVLIDLIEGRTP